MGLFDSFGKRTNRERRESSNINFSSGNDTPMQVINNGQTEAKLMKNFSPEKKGDIQAIIAHLREGNPAIVRVSHLKEHSAAKVIDMLSAAAFALYGSIEELDNGMFMLMPSGMKYAN